MLVDAEITDVLTREFDSAFETSPLILHGLSTHEKKNLRKTREANFH